MDDFLLSVIIPVFNEQENIKPFLDQLLPVIKKYKPDIICLGYDQRGLDEDLQMRIRRGDLPRIRLMRLEPHKPKRYKTSLVRRKLQKL